MVRTKAELESTFKLFQGLKLQIEQTKQETKEVCRLMTLYNKQYREGKEKIERLNERILSLI